MRTVSIAVPIAVLAALATACSSGSTRDTAADLSPARVTSTPTLATLKDRTLPVEAYLLNGKQSAQIQNAIDILTTRCMLRFGLGYKPPQPDLDSPVNQTARRYGSTDASVTASLGYHAPAAFGTATPVKAGLSDEQRLVLTAGVAPGTASASPATAKRVNGQEIPPAGCLGEATAKVHPDAGLRTVAELADQINLGDYQRSTQDPQVEQVFAAWSSCMKEKGYAYRTPMDAMNDHRWATDGPTKTEIETATADLDCKTRNNVVGVWYSVETAMETHDIGLKATDLNKLRDDNQAALKRAAQVAAGG